MTAAENTKAVQWAFFGALFGVLIVPVLLGMHVHSPALLLALWPTSIELVGNAVLYGFIVFWISKWILQRRSAS